MQIANSKQFPPLETVTRPTVETAAAAFYFNRREKTLRGWACHEDGPSGYQRFRAKDSLAKILEPYVAKKLQPYVSLFPPEFYQEIFRLRGLSFPTGAVKRPQYFGHITNDIIYRRLAPGVWKELKAKVQKDEKGRAKHKLFQHLTPTFGDPRLEKLITRVTTIMEFSSTWGDFKLKLDAKVPAFNETMQLPFDIRNDDGKGL